MAIKEYKNIDFRQIHYVKGRHVKLFQYKDLQHGWDEIPLGQFTSILVVPDQKDSNIFYWRLLNGVIIKAGQADVMKKQKKSVRDYIYGFIIDFDMTLIEYKNSCYADDRDLNYFGRRARLPQCQTYKFSSDTPDNSKLIGIERWEGSSSLLWA